MSAYPKEFSPVLFLVLAGFCIYLHLLGRLTSKSLGVTILLSAISVFLIHNLDVVQRLVIKGYGLETSVEVREIQKQLYAKVDEVKRMGEDIAEMLAWTVANVNRLVGEDFQERLIRQRENLRRALTDLGTEERRREEIVSPITQIVARDLQSDIVVEADRLSYNMPKQSRESFVRELGATLRNTDQKKGLEFALEKLRPTGLHSEQLDSAITRYRIYITEDRLTPSSSNEKEN